MNFAGVGTWASEAMTRPIPNTFCRRATSLARPPSIGPLMICTNWSQPSHDIDTTTSMTEEEYKKQCRRNLSHITQVVRENE